MNTNPRCPDDGDVLALLPGERSVSHHPRWPQPPSEGAWGPTSALPLRNAQVVGRPLPAQQHRVGQRQRPDAPRKRRDPTGTPDHLWSGQASLDCMLRPHRLSGGAHAQPLWKGAIGPRSRTGKRKVKHTLNLTVFGRRKARRTSGVPRASAPPGRPQGPPR